MGLAVCKYLRDIKEGREDVAETNQLLGPDSVKVDLEKTYDRHFDGCWPLPAMFIELIMKFIKTASLQILRNGYLFSGNFLVSEIQVPMFFPWG